MTEKTIEAFTLDEYDLWYDNAALKVPAAPSNADCILASEAHSFNYRTQPTGIVISLKLDNQPALIFKLNPILVWQMLREFTAGGQASQWLDSKCNIMIPVIVERT